MAEQIARIIQAELIASSQSYPVVTVIGPRQSGKTTLAKMTFPDKSYVDLEAPDQRSFALSDPRRFLAQFPSGAILDEIQQAPELLSYIQTLVDEQDQQGLFILTGSHQLSLQQGITQSLAGRTGMLYLLPLSLEELKPIAGHFSLEQQLFYGGYPRIYKHNIAPQRYYRDYVQTYLERDVKQLINIKDMNQFQRFLHLCAARSGQLLDYTSFSNELGLARQTIKEWLSLLKASFIITTLSPFFENFGKRIIKSPKLYFNDVGLLSYLLGIQDSNQLQNHPLRGHLYENLIVMETFKLHTNQGKDTKLYFYRDNNQNEIDIIYIEGKNLIGIEAKSSQTFHTDFLKILRKYKEIVRRYSFKGYVIYSGEIEQTVNDVQLINYNNMADYL